MSRLNCSLIGQFQVTLEDQALDLGYNKVRALLAYLVVESGQAHARAELAALLWPESPEATARKNLRQAFSVLRQAIRPDPSRPAYFLLVGETIQFNHASDYYSDVDEFTTLVERSAAHRHPGLEDCPECFERLGRAVALYRGELLKGLAVAGCLPFEEWLLLGRERLRLQMIEALGRLVATCERGGDDDSAVQYSRRRLALDPWNEDAYRSLMRALARRGLRTAALAEFERCKRLLADELGIEPSQETRDLFSQIRGAPLPPSPNPQNGAEKSGARPFPLPLTPLIGREPESAALLDLLRRDGVRLVTLLGPPGIGKTRMALHVAGALDEDYAENACFVSLADVTNPALAVPAIAAALGLSEGGSNTLFDQLVQALAGRKFLLVLDNFEQVLDAAPALSDFLQACPRLKILVTARAPLRLRGEQRFVLSPLSVPDPLAVPEPARLLASPAVRLFVERVQSIRPNFTLGPRNAPAVAAICVRLDGLPLAIELAAAAIRLMSPQRLLERLTGESGAAFQVLKQLERDGSPNHHSLSQAFQWSYDLLDPAARQLFVRLGVFVGGATLEAIDAVCNVGDLLPAGMDSLASLLDNSLLQQEEGLDGDYRFSMLSTLREFALAHLSAGEEWDALRQRHADYFLTFARLAEPQLTGRQQLAWLERLEKELPNLHQALDWTLQASIDQALHLAVALFPFWHARSYLNEGRYYLERALAACTAPSPLRARALAVAGLLAQRQGDFQRATQLITQGVALNRQLEEPIGLAYALNNLAIVLMSEGENEAALQAASESQAICVQQAYPLGLARAQMILGQVALNEDRLAEARRALETSLAFWRTHGDLKNEILCLINLGRAGIMQGRYAESLSLFEECLALSRQLKDLQWELVALWNSAEIHLRRGSPQLAAPLLQSCLEHSLRLGDRYFEALSLGRLGQVALERRAHAEGAGLIQASLALGRQVGSRWLVADALSNLGYAALLQLDFKAARTALLESLALFSTQGERSSLALNLELLALVELGQGQLERSACLLAAASAWRAASQEPLPPASQPRQEQALEDLRARLGQPDFARAWERGLTFSLEQALTYAAG